MYGKKLKELRMIEGWTQEEVAKKLGVSKQTYNHYENEKRKPGLTTIKKLAEVYQVDLDRIFGTYDDNKPNELNVKEGSESYSVNNLIPLLGNVAAGEPIFAEQNIIGYAPQPPLMNISNRNVFYLKVKGDSMNREFADGSFVLVDHDLQVEKGQIAAVRVNGNEATVKKVSWDDRYFTLIPMSYDDSFYPEVIDLKEKDVTIIGKVIGVYKTY